MMKSTINMIASGFFHLLTTEQERNVFYDYWNNRWKIAYGVDRPDRAWSQEALIWIRSRKKKAELVYNEETMCFEEIVAEES